MAKSKAPLRREIRCYFCGHKFEVSQRTMSVPCPSCNKALKVEDILIKTYLPVNDLQTCGKITVAKNGRVVAKIIRSGDGIDCQGALEGVIETDGALSLGPNGSWKGKTLHSRTLEITDGAQLVGYVKVPFFRPEPDKKSERKSSASSRKQAVALDDDGP